MLLKALDTKHWTLDTVSTEQGGVSTGCIGHYALAMEEGEGLYIAVSGGIGLERRGKRA